jgi:hypothetical protein
MRELPLSEKLWWQARRDRQTRMDRRLDLLLIAFGLVR